MWTSTLHTTIISDSFGQGSVCSRWSPDGHHGWGDQCSAHDGRS